MLINIFSSSTRTLGIGFLKEKDVMKPQLEGKDMDKENKIRKIIDDIKDKGFADKHLYFPCKEVFEQSQDL